MSRIWLFLFALWLSCPALAGGRGGHTTTFDPNLFGGPANVSCIKASAAGICNTGYNATCNGIADDTTAFTNFVTANVGGTAVLYIPPGANCVSNTHINGLGPGTTPIKNLTVWGYGAKWNATFIGGSFDTTPKLGLINSTNIGDTSVTLINSGDAAKFAIGNWVCVCGLEIQGGSQGGGFPPNFYYHEFRAITNISGSTVTLSSPLSNQYLSTWPVANAPNDGPAAIWLMDPTWNSSTAIYGVNFVFANEFVAGGRTVALYDVVIPIAANFDPTVNQSIFIFGSWLGSPEFDKDIELAYLFRSSVNFAIIQSPTPEQLIIEGGNYPNLNGWAKNTTFRNVTIPGTLKVGPICCGHGTSVLAENSSIATAVTNTNGIVASTVTFSAGTFSIPQNSSATDVFLAMSVPGRKYHFADSDGTNNCVNTPQSACTFTITAVRQDVTNFYADTDIGSTLPTPTCNLHACPLYSPYPAATITQRFTGPANLTIFAAPP